MVKGRILPFALAVLGTLGCAADSEPDPPTFHTVSQEIKGGEIDHNHPAVVGLVTTSGYSAGICSGTLIAPNLVLTAQHCVAQIGSQYIQCGRTSFGSTRSTQGVFVTTNRYLTNDQSAYHPVEEIFTAEKDDVCGNDIALLLLGDNVPASEAEPIVPRIDSAVERGEVYTAIGYGHIGDGSGSGVRRILDNRRVQCEGDLCPNYTQVVAAEFLGSAGTCQGDSGGPAIDEDGRVLGALSRGAGECQSSTYSAVYGWADWIIEKAEIAAERGEYEIPFWAKHRVSQIPPDDLDLDGVVVDSDNCPETFNEDQIDVDEDGIGNACDDNNDLDTLLDDSDNCPLIANEDQLDYDGDGFGDACDQDDDGDGVDDDADFCPKNEKFIDYGSDCSITEDVVVLKEKGCQQSTTASGAPTGLGAVLALLGLFGLRRRRRD